MKIIREMTLKEFQNLTYYEQMSIGKNYVITDKEDRKVKYEMTLKEFQNLIYYEEMTIGKNCVIKG